MSRLRSFALFAALTLACTGPLSCSSTKEVDAGATVDMSPLPAPEGLVAEVVLPAPQATWVKARGALGGPALFLPQSFGATVMTLAGLPVTYAAEIDEAVPALGAVVKPKDKPSFGAVALHVKSGERLADQLTKGEEARFKARREPSGITWIEPKDGGSRGYAVAMMGNYLLLAKTGDDLSAVGPYLVRTLATRPPPKEDMVIEMPEAALAGPVLAEARAARERGARIGSPVLPIGTLTDTLFDVLADAKGARLALSLDGQNIRARFVSAPKTSGGPAAKALSKIAVGDHKPILDLPRSASVAVLWRESPEARKAALSAQTDALVKLAGDLPEDDKKAISAALEALAEARGEVTALGVTFAGTGPTGYVRSPVADEEKTKKAVSDLVSLLRSKGIQATLEKKGISATPGKAVVENLPGDVGKIHFEREEPDAAKKDEKAPAKKDDKAPPKKDDKAPKKDEKAPPKKDDKAPPKKDDKAPPAPPAPGETPKAIDLLYLIQDKTFWAAAGFDPKDALRELIKEGPRLNESKMAGALNGLSDDVAFVMLADLPRILAVMRRTPAPVDVTPALFAVGRSRAEAPELWITLDVPAAAAQVLVRELSRGGR